MRRAAPVSWRSERDITCAAPNLPQHLDRLVDLGERHGQARDHRHAPFAPDRRRHVHQAPAHGRAPARARPRLPLQRAQHLGPVVVVLDAVERLAIHVGVAEHDAIGPDEGHARAPRTAQAVRERRPLIPAGVRGARVDLARFLIDGLLDQVEARDQILPDAVDQVGLDAVAQVDLTSQDREDNQAQRDREELGADADPHGGCLGGGAPTKR
jgi:hypothetical protein